MKKNKIFFFFLLIAILCVNLTACYRTSFTFTELEDGTYEVNSKSDAKYEGTVIIPATYKGKQVTRIGSFSYNSTITSVSIPEGILVISAHAFRGCSIKDDVVIPEGVTTIGAGAFSENHFLRSISLPSTLTDIGYNAFMDCTDLDTINYNNTREEYKKHFNSADTFRIRKKEGIYSVHCTDGDLYYTYEDDSWFEDYWRKNYLN